MAWPGIDRRPSDVETHEFIGEIWSSKILDHVRSHLVAANVVNTTFKAELTMGDKIYIPVTKELSASLVDPTSTAAIVNMNTTTAAADVTVSISHWEEAPVQIDDSVKTQTQVGNLLEVMANNAAYALEKSIDEDVMYLFQGLNTTTVTGIYGSDGQTFTDDMLVYMMEVLDEGDVPRDGRNLVGDPSMLADCYKIDKFMNFDYTKSPLGGQNGYRGTIPAYNVPVYITTHLYDADTGGHGALLHPDAIGLIIQDGPTVEKWRAPQVHSDIINISAMWGEGELRDTFGVCFYTRKKSN